MNEKNKKVRWTWRALFPLLFLVLGAGIGLCYLSDPVTWESYPLDDAWIHMVYARNTVQGFPLSFNPPDPEAGFSSPLWLACMIVVQFFTQNILVSKVIGLVFLVALAWAASRLAGPLAGLLLLFDPWLQFAALSGMEITGFAFLAVLAMERLIRDKPGQAGTAAAGAFLMRPEGALLMPLLLLFSFLPRAESARAAPATSPGPWLKKAFLLTGPTILAACCWSAYCLSITGRPFPNTFYVKTQLGGFFLMDNFLESLSLLLSDCYRFLVQSGPFYPLLVGILLALSILYRPDRRVVAAWIFVVGVFVGSWLTRPVIRIEAFYWARYFIPALAGLYLLAGISLLRLWNRTGLARKGTALCLGVALASTLLAHTPRSIQLYHLNCRDVARYNVAAGRWIAENTDPKGIVAVHDAGAISYFCDRKILDLGGLNDHTLTDLTDLKNRLGVSDSAALASYLGADWLVLFERHFSGSGDFNIENTINYDDYSLYIIPERFTLLLLKKASD